MNPLNIAATHQAFRQLTSEKDAYILKNLLKPYLEPFYNSYNFLWVQRKAYLQGDFYTFQSANPGYITPSTSLLFIDAILRGNVIFALEIVERKFSRFGLCVQCLAAYLATLRNHPMLVRQMLKNCQNQQQGLINYILLASRTQPAHANAYSEMTKSCAEISFDKGFVMYFMAGMYYDDSAVEYLYEREVFEMAKVDMMVCGALVAKRYNIARKILLSQLDVCKFWHKRAFYVYAHFATPQFIKWMWQQIASELPTKYYYTWPMSYVVIGRRDLAELIAQFRQTPEIVESSEKYPDIYGALFSVGQSTYNPVSYHLLTINIAYGIINPRDPYIAEYISGWEPSGNELEKLQIAGLDIDFCLFETPMHCTEENVHFCLRRSRTKTLGKIFAKQSRIKPELVLHIHEWSDEEYVLLLQSFADSREKLCKILQQFLGSCQDTKKLQQVLDISAKIIEHLPN